MIVPKISVIIPVYNGEKYLEKCIASFREQTFNDFEIIIVNDGSKDGTANKIKKVKKEWNGIYKIKSFYQNNKGVSAARNTGINKALANYILFVDIDDWLDKSYFETMYIQTKKNNADFAFCEWFEEKREEISIGKISIPESEEMSISESLFKHFSKSFNGGSPWGKIYKNGIIKENKIFFTEGIPYGEDFLFNYEYLSHSQNAIKISEPLYHYNMISEGAGSTLRLNYFEIQLEIYKMKKLILQKSGKLNKEYKQYLEESFLLTIYNYFDLFIGKGKGKIYETKIIKKVMKNEELINFMKNKIHNSNMPLKVKLLIFLLKFNKLVYVRYYHFFINLIKR